MTTRRLGLSILLTLALTACDDTSTRSNDAGTTTNADSGTDAALPCPAGTDGTTCAPCPTGTFGDGQHACIA